MPHRSLKTVLKDRILWYDGDSTVDPDRIVELLSTGIPVSGLYVNEVTDEIARYNKLVDDDEKITVKINSQDLDFEWNIPQEYKELDVEEHIYNLCDPLGSGEGYKQLCRIQEELHLYKQLELMDVLRVLIYVINTLQTHNIVWGVGRGSSVASYILYLIGVHDIDSIKYDLDITDFLRVNES